ncbi:hypothetical protein MKW92_036108, partial [Papaver armeniacum]
MCRPVTDLWDVCMVRKGELMFPPLAFNATYISCVLSSSQDMLMIMYSILQAPERFD